MTERYTLEQFEADLKAREEREAKEEQARWAKTEKETARRLWLNDGGSEKDFERQWPSMRDDARKQRVADADRKAREAARETTRTRF